MQVSVIQAANSHSVFVSRPLSVRSFAICGTLAVGVVVTGIAAGALPTSIRVPGALLILGVAVLAALRGLRIAIIADETGVVVQNLWATYRLNWEEVETVGIGTHYFFVQLPAVAFRVRGESSWVTALATVTSERECRRVIRALAHVRQDLPIRFSE